MPLKARDAMARSSDADTEKQDGLPPVRDDYRRHYRSWHDETDAHFNDMARQYENKLTSLLGSLSGASVLEIGCGAGFCLGALARLSASVVEGIDADRSQIEVARARGLNALHVPIAAFPAYAETHQRTYDDVLMFDVLEHVPGEERLMFLRRTWSMLKPGGRMVCQVPNANSFVGSRYRYIDATHTTTFTEHSLDFELYRAGFDDIIIREADPIQRPWLRRPREVARWVAHRSMRRVLRWCYELEVGARDAGKMPLTPNIIATAVRAPAYIGDQ